MRTTALLVVLLLAGTLAVAAPGQAFHICGCPQDNYVDCDTHQIRIIIPPPCGPPLPPVFETDRLLP